jgi:SAM-dependent methyltransferase
MRKIGNYNFRQRQIKKLVESFDLGKTNLRILDVCCGNDPVSLYFNARERTLLLDKDKEVPSLDLYEDVDKPDYRLPFSDNHFDAVVFTDSLAHIENQDKIISECSRVGKALIFSSVVRGQTRQIYRNLTGRDTEKNHTNELDYDQIIQLLGKHYERYQIVGYSLQIPFLSLVYATFPRKIIDLIEYAGEKIPKGSAKLLALCQK